MNNEQVTCVSCQQRFDTAGVAYTTTDNEPLCSDCYDESYFTCSHCDEIYHLDDSQSCGNCDDMWCTACWDRRHNFSCSFHDVSLCSYCYVHHAYCGSDEDDNTYESWYRSCDTAT